MAFSSSIPGIALKSLQDRIKGKCQGLRQFRLAAARRAFDQNRLLQLSRYVHLGERDLINDVLGLLEFLAEVIDRRKHVGLYPQPGFYGKMRFSPKSPTALLGGEGASPSHKSGTAVRPAGPWSEVDAHLSARSGPLLEIAARATAYTFRVANALCYVYGCAVRTLIGAWCDANLKQKRLRSGLRHRWRHSRTSREIGSPAIQARLSQNGRRLAPPERQAIFVGDFIDRGPSQVQTVNTVRRMVEAGVALAVMGNHDLNAIAWHIPNPGHPGEFLRPHHSAKWGENNRRQHAAFLAEVEDKPALHAEIIEWFLSLPLWLDLPELQVVHACWHGPFMAWLSPQLHGGRCLTRDLMVPATDEPANEADKDNATPTVFKAIEALTKGIEVPLPAGQDFLDKDGIRRNRVRLRWWDEGGTTYRSAAMLSPEERAALPDIPIPSMRSLKRRSSRPSLGITGSPARLRYNPTGPSALTTAPEMGGYLVAYRFDWGVGSVPRALRMGDLGYRSD